MNPAFDTLPDQSDCWIYAANRPLEAQEVAHLEQLFASFAQGWSSHGRKISGGCEILDGRIMIIAAHIEGGDISGCGIDKSLHLLQEAAASSGFSWASALSIVYRDENGQLVVSTRKAFREAAAAGLIDEETRVLDLSIRQLGALRSGGLERRAADSWHAALLPAVAGS
jgi:hypothetical protein